MLLLVPEGRHMPCQHTCLLTVDRGLVTIKAKSRERLFEQARRFFRAHARKLPALNVAATLESPREHRRMRDAVMISVNSDVTFSFTGIEPDIRPALRLVEPERAIAS